MLTMEQTKTTKVTSEPGIDEPEAAHSALGPSSSERWIPCPGSVLLTKDMPDTESSYAIEGTAAHILSEHIRLNPEHVAKDFVGQYVRVEHQTDGDYTDIEITAEFADGVQRFVDYVSGLPGKPFFEVRVSYDAWVPGGFGTADDIRIDQGTVYVTDLKFGKGVQVWAKENPQLMLYALGVFQEFSHLYDMDKVVLTIHQPRLDHVDTWETDYKTLLKWAKDVAAPAAKAALKPGGKFQAGEHCRFCAAKNVCKERARWAFEQTIGDFDDLDADHTDVKAGPEFMTMEELGHVLDHISTIKSWCSDMEAYGLSQLQKGHPPIGKDGEYKLVEGRAARNFRDESEAEKLLRKKLKVSQIFTKKLVSPAQAEKLLGKKAAGELLGEVIVKTPGRPVMVPATDRRQPLVVKAEDVFDDLEEQENGDAG